MSNMDGLVLVKFSGMIECVFRAFRSKIGITILEIYQYRNEMEPEILRPNWASVAIAKEDRLGHALESLLYSRYLESRVRQILYHLQS